MEKEQLEVTRRAIMLDRAASLTRWCEIPRHPSLRKVYYSDSTIDTHHWILSRVGPFPHGTTHSRSISTITDR